MSKPVYKVMDSKGRVLIPRELRLAAGMYGGDILALQLREGKVSVRKVEIVEVGTSHQKQWRPMSAPPLKLCRIRSA